MVDFSVIVPVLNDDRRLKELLSELSEACSDVVVIDGGDSEFAKELAKLHGAVYANCSPSRGGQIARGLDLTSKEVIWVLHVDAYNLSQAISRLTEITDSRQVVWGRLMLRCCGFDGFHV